MAVEGKKGAGKMEGGSGKENAVGKARRITALIGVVFLAGLYLVTFVLAVLGNESSTQLLRFCFGMTIFVPIFIWVITWCVGILFHKKTFASLELLNSDPEERQKMEEAVAHQMEADERESQVSEKK